VHEEGCVRGVCCRNGAAASVRGVRRPSVSGG
jgi:hypothetical protein